MDEVRSPTLAVIQGRETILLGTYNYMGMTFDPDVVAAGEKALGEVGSGTTRSPGLQGTHARHKTVGQGLKAFSPLVPPMGLFTRFPPHPAILPLTPTTG